MTNEHRIAVGDLVHLSDGGGPTMLVTLIAVPAPRVAVLAFATLLAALPSRAQRP
jgi:hypothetical protein